MTPAITRANEATHNVTLEQAVIDEIEKLRDGGELYRVEPRCHICCEVESRDLVNKLISASLTNREIAQACQGINARRKEAKDKRQITARTVWSHKANKHWTVDDVAVGVYREIAERRAEQANRDHINGVGHLITPYAVLETVMVDGYQYLRSAPEVHPTISETMSAAKTLHEFENADAGQRQMADVLFKMERIIQAAQQFVPAEKHAAFLAAVEGRDQPLAVLAERVHDAGKKIKEFTPPKDTDERDQI